MVAHGAGRHLVTTGDLGVKLTRYQQGSEHRIGRKFPGRRTAAHPTPLYRCVRLARMYAALHGLQADCPLAFGRTRHLAQIGSPPGV